MDKNLLVKTLKVNNPDPLVIMRGDDESASDWANRLTNHFLPGQVVDSPDDVVIAFNDDWTALGGVVTKGNGLFRFGVAHLGEDTNVLSPTTIEALGDIVFKRD